MGRLYHDAKKTAENFGDPASAAFLAGDEYLAKAVDAVFNVISSPRVSSRTGPASRGR